MRTLKDHVILYDEECPMCSLYTKAFVKSGMLDQSGRTCYQNMPSKIASHVDAKRAVNEIALVNKETGEVKYGVLSLFAIISYALPLFTWLFTCRPFIWMMSKAYAFISYNRRVIIPSNAIRPSELQPSFLLHYRVAYLLFTWLATSFILSSYAHLLSGVVPDSHAYREYVVCGGQIIFQGIIVTIIHHRKTWEYLGNMMTISFAGALLLLPGLLLAKFFDLSPVFYTVYFLVVASCMLIEHIRRTKLLRLGWTLTVTWAFYRAVVLFVILYIS